MIIEKIAELHGHTNPVYTIELSQKAGIIFTGGNDKGVVEWSLKNMAFLKIMFPVLSSVYAIHCPVGYPLMFAGLRNGQVFVFNFIEQKVVRSLNHHLKPVFDIKSINHKKELLIASEDGTVSIWHLDTLELLHSIKVSHDTIRSIAISPDEKQVAFGCRDNSVYVYNLQDYTLIITLRSHTMAVFTTQYSPDGKYILSGGRDAQLKYGIPKPLHLSKISPHTFLPLTTSYFIQHYRCLPQPVWIKVSGYGTQKSCIY